MSVSGSFQVNEIDLAVELDKMKLSWHKTASVGLLTQFCDSDQGLVWVFSV